MKSRSSMCTPAHTRSARPRPTSRRKPSTSLLSIRASAHPDAASHSGIRREAHSSLPITEFTPFWPEQDRLNVRELTNESLWLSGHSITFHGRDLFAPAAAQLAAELIDWADLGPPVLDVIRLPNLKAVQSRGGQWVGTILSVDRFGNVITNLPSRIGLSPGFAVTVAGHEIRQFRRTFGEAAPDELFVYAGSSGYYEIGINQQSAAERLGVVPGHPVLLAVSA